MSNKLQKTQYGFTVLVIIFLAITIYNDSTIIFALAGISLFISFMIGLYLGFQRIEEVFKNDQNTSGNSADDVDKLA